MGKKSSFLFCSDYTVKCFAILAKCIHQAFTSLALMFLNCLFLCLGGPKNTENKEHHDYSTYNLLEHLLLQIAVSINSLTSLDVLFKVEQKNKKILCYGVVRVQSTTCGSPSMWKEKGVIPE